jgi:HEAT repeat protein
VNGIAAVLAVVLSTALLAQEPSAPEAVGPAAFKAALDALGSLDYAARSAGARTIRRTPATQAVPLLTAAAATHQDGYVRFRALVLLTGFNDPKTADAVREAQISPNDRLRTVAYNFYEHTPDRSRLPALLGALEGEVAEFVRPSLIRALGAMGDDERVQRALLREVDRGEDFFRSAVIEALGDFKARYAYDALTRIAGLEGPLQDDAALALGKLGDARAVETLAGLQRSAPRVRQPFIAAAICLLGTNCDSHERYLVETLTFADRNPGFQDLLRGAAAGLGALAMAGRAEALAALFDAGIPSRDPTRSPVALAAATVALRRPSTMLTFLGGRADRREATSLLAEGFDMLDEDFEKERFFALARRTYWNAPDGSPARDLMQTLIGKLDF